ncbi:hypothetical protein [Streptomyces sp. NPDC001978]|uniref:hypothetical protein n=1 Tax=Streptomyces sp. NPDC001978 TaxID=3364627 RepID=UPI00368AD2A3
MNGIPVPEAARMLSMSAVSTYDAMRSGRLERVPGTTPARVTAASVSRLAADRRAEALLRRSDLCALARQADSLLHALPGSTCAPPPGPEALKALSADTFAIFGRDVLEAAASRDRISKHGGCPTCWAHLSSRIHQTQPPRDEAAWKILLGQPCPKDRQRWAAESDARRREMASLRLTEQKRAREAEQAALRAEYETARTDVRRAASRLQTATRAYAPLDPSVAAQAAAQARERVEFANRPKRQRPAGCDCDADHQCAAHAEMDRRAARKPKPMGWR